MRSDSPTNEAKALARSIVDLCRQLGDAIECANKAGCSVSLEVWFNGGSESTVLHQLSGEFDPSVVWAVELTEQA